MRATGSSCSQVLRQQVRSNVHQLPRSPIDRQRNEQCTASGLFGQQSNLFKSSDWNRVQSQQKEEEKSDRRSQSGAPSHRPTLCGRAIGIY
jgi:hypothetical protein